MSGFSLFMMKLLAVGGIILGLLFLFLAVRLFLSGESYGLAVLLSVFNLIAGIYLLKAVYGKSSV